MENVDTALQEFCLLQGMERNTEFYYALHNSIFFKTFNVCYLKYNIAIKKKKSCTTYIDRLIFCTSYTCMYIKIIQVTLLLTQLVC